MEVKIVKSKIEDIAHIAENMREIDVKEIFLSSGHSPYQSLKIGFETSGICYTIFLDDEAIGMFGVVKPTLMSNYGVIWFLATDKMELIKKTFLRKCGSFINELYEVGVDRLENYVWAQNKKSILWLKWLGFTFEEPKEYGKGKALFMRFYKGKENV